MSSPPYKRPKPCQFPPSLLRLLARTLDDAGLSASARTLEKEGNIFIRSSKTLSVRSCILEREWKKAKENIAKMHLSETCAISILRLIKVQQGLEMIERAEWEQVFMWCNTCENDDLEKMSLLLLRSEVADIQKCFSWYQDNSQEPKRLWIEIERLLPTEHVAPSGRLEVK